MNVRSDLSEARKITVTDRDIEEKLKRITGSGFQILKEQLEIKRNVFLSAVNRAKSLESKSNYYSTDNLKKKLNIGLITAFKNPTLTDPLSLIQEKSAGDFDSIFKRIDTIQDKFKLKIKNNFTITQKFSAAIQEMQAPLDERLNQFKSDLIDTLQAAANEYRLFLLSKGVWQKKFPEFTDKFGCVSRIKASESPYDLDTSAGMGLEFGHKIREAKKCPSIEAPLSFIKKMPLADLEKMLNRVITECIYYTEDSDKVLKIIAHHYDNMASKYHDYFQRDVEGYFYKRLKKFKLVAEKEIDSEPLKLAKSELEKLENNQNSKLLEEINQSLNELQKLVNTLNIKIDENIATIKQESSVAINLLSGPSEKCYKKIATLNSGMKMVNAETKTHLLAASGVSHQVQVRYEDAIRMAKFRDKSEFERHEKLAIDALKKAESSLAFSKENIARLENFDQIINKKLKYAKEHFDGSIHRIPEAAFARECKIYERIKTSSRIVTKDFNAVTPLPYAIKKYGEIIFHCANIQADIVTADQYAKNASQAVLLMWSAYNEAFNDAKSVNLAKVKEQSKKMNDQLETAGKLLKDEIEILDNAKNAQNGIQQKLLEAKNIFPVEIHREHQDTLDMLCMQYMDAVKQKETTEAMITGVKTLPVALTEYTQIIMNCADMQEMIAQTKAACVKADLTVGEITRACDESLRLAKAGVVKRSLEEKSLKRLEEAKATLQLATERLKRAEEIKLTEQKKLSDAGQRFTKEMHAKPQEIFDAVNNAYAEVVVAQGVAEKTVVAAGETFKKIQEHLAKAKQIEKEKQIATQLKQVILSTIFNNMDLWRIGKWGGGVTYQYDGKQFRIPHGVAELLSQLLRSMDHNQWIKNVKKMAADRDQMGRTQWKYTLFHVRDESTTGVLYHAIKQHLELEEGSVEALEGALSKIPRLRRESLPQQRR